MSAAAAGERERNLGDLRASMTCLLPLLGSNFSPSKTHMTPSAPRLTLARQQAQDCADRQRQAARLSRARLQAAAAARTGRPHGWRAAGRAGARAALHPQPLGRGWVAAWAASGVGRCISFAALRMTCAFCMGVLPCLLTLPMSQQLDLGACPTLCAVPPSHHPVHPFLSCSLQPARPGAG